MSLLRDVPSANRSGAEMCESTWYGSERSLVNNKVCRTAYDASMTGEHSLQQDVSPCQDQAAVIKLLVLADFQARQIVPVGKAPQ